MSLSDVTLSRQFEDIEFIHGQFKWQPDKIMHKHYRTILISLCKRILECEEFQRMLKQEGIYMEQIKVIRQKISEVQRDIETYVG